MSVIIWDNSTDIFHTVGSLSNYIAQILLRVGILHKHQPLKTSIINSKKLVLLSCHRVVYTAEDVGHLMDFLASVKFCLCGAPCFRSHVHFLLPLTLSRVAASVTAASGYGQAPSEAFLCSRKCLNKYQKNPQATIWR